MSLRDYLFGRWIAGKLAATIGFGAKHSMRIGHEALPVLRFSRDSAYLVGHKPRGTYAQPSRYPVSTHGKPRISARLHFFCNKIANGC